MKMQCGCKVTQAQIDAAKNYHKGKTITFVCDVHDTQSTPMKHGIELNGVANLLIQVDSLDEYTHYLHRESFQQMKEQLNLLERYMLAYNEAINRGATPPAWHEVKSNPKLYKTNRER
jgi:hypothetical protein